MLRDDAFIAGAHLKGIPGKPSGGFSALVYSV
jgi:hypothetical protein